MVLEIQFSQKLIAVWQIMRNLQPKMATSLESGALDAVLIINYLLELRVAIRECAKVFLQTKPAHYSAVSIDEICSPEPCIGQPYGLWRVASWAALL
jgi:hypothetical protein